MNFKTKKQQLERLVKSAVKGRERLFYDIIEDGNILLCDSYSIYSFKESVVKEMMEKYGTKLNEWKHLDAVSRYWNGWKDQSLRVINLGDRQNIPGTRASVYNTNVDNMYINTKFMVKGAYMYEQIKAKTFMPIYCSNDSGEMIALIMPIKYEENMN